MMMKNKMMAISEDCDLHKPLCRTQHPLLFTSLFLSTGHYSSVRHQSKQNDLNGHPLCARSMSQQQPLGCIYIRDLSKYSFISFHLFLHIPHGLTSFQRRLKLNEILSHRKWLTIDRTNENWSITRLSFSQAHYSLLFIPICLSRFSLLLLFYFSTSHRVVESDMSRMKDMVNETSRKEWALCSTTWKKAG